MKKVINIVNGITRNPAWNMAEPVNFTLLEGEQVAVVGPNGAGKSMFIDIVTSRHPLIGNGVEYDFSPNRHELNSDNIKYITFRDSYGAENDRTYFLQQRWNQMEISDDAPRVSDALDEAYNLCGADTQQRREFREKIYRLFGIDGLQGKLLLMLSSGEMRKLQLVKTLMAEPKVLIMDNPFIGLDAGTREQLRQLLETITSELRLQTILVLSKTNDIPDYITHVVEVNDMKVGRKMTLDEYRAKRSSMVIEGLSDEKKELILNLEYNGDYAENCDEVVKMNEVSIRYGSHVILDTLNWTVRKGEKWALSGENGAGKSTLLSLVCADNPQSYACDITLFGKERGTGESIWDIKKHIGYVSPEMHRAYNKDLPAIRIVASGLMDSIGLYAKPDEKDYEKCRFWMNIFGLEDMEERTFLKLSSGEQRLVLLARAFVKDPDLLILDEPLHGLDDANRKLVKDIINTFVKRKDKTMIMVSHYQEELPSCIDNHIMLQKARSEELGVRS